MNYDKYKIDLGPLRELAIDAAIAARVGGYDHIALTLNCISEKLIDIARQQDCLRMSIDGDVVRFERNMTEAELQEFNRMLNGQGNGFLMLPIVPTQQGGKS